MITGNQLRDAIISASNNIALHKREVNELNVFPVPDGDTGTNMSLSIGNAQKELEHLQDGASVSEVASLTASSLLRGARGNSGVILSLLFRGLAKGLSGLETATTEDLSQAWQTGVESAYKAVMKPTEGTILTVARIAAEKTADHIDLAPGEFSLLLLEEAKAALLTTPDLLPVLKKAGVVDAGGQGLVYILEGISSVLSGAGIIRNVVDESTGEETASVSSTAFDVVDEDITFGYCTEFIIEKSEDAAESLTLRAYLETIGDCVLVVEDDDIIKVHVHTDHPGLALEEAVRFGLLSRIKIENMREQNARLRGPSKKSSAPIAIKDDFPYQAVDPDMPFGFVAVAAGEGIRQLFLDLGVNAVVSGGQTMNPSTEDILKAVQSVPAAHVFVLPNNKNIILAAEQATRLADREVSVLQTRTIPQGLSAMLAFDPGISAEENQIAMRAAYDQVETGLVTFAARDSDFDGYKIQKDEILALHNGKLSFTEKDMLKAAYKLTRSLVSKNTLFVTILYGEDVTQEQADALEEMLRAKLSDNIELSILSGGQPVYYFIISVE